jgi:hypothetical protein
MTPETARTPTDPDRRPGTSVAPVDGGVYVLADDGPPEHWRDEFVATARTG